FQQAGIDKLPLPTAILIGLSDLVTKKWYFLLFGILLLIIIIRMYIKSPGGRMFWDGLKLKIPLAKNVLMPLTTVRFCRTFSTLLSSGMPMLQALSIVMNVVNNKVVSEQLSETSEDIRKGMSLTNSIRRVSVFPPMLQSMISIGEESGSLESMLDNTSDYYNDVLENSISKMIALIEPIMIVIMAGVVGFIILAIMLPMLQIYQSI
ncbi:MAG: type II secretion system F family protein, partial [Clostridiales bacterium]|nr:type II secretion system F family protein [Clostridiales bacterium]